MVSNHIKPRLNIYDLSMIVVGLIIGMGIFRTPVEVAQKAGIPSIFFIAWILGAAISMIGALTFAEIGSRYPTAGGYYKIFSYCYHPAFAFMVNWMTVINNAVSTALVAIMGAEYIVPILLPDWEHELAVRVVTISAVASLYTINLFGIKISAKLLNGLMAIKIGLILLLVMAIFMPHTPTQQANVQPAQELDTMGWLKALVLCFIPVFFTYGGYQETINFGSDIPNANKAVPRAILIGTLIVLFLYLSINFAYYEVLGFEQLGHTTTLAADMGRVVLGDLAAKVISILMFFSVMAYVNVSLMTNPRVYLAMSEDGVLPGVFGKVNPKTQIQEFAVTVFCLFIILTLFFLSSVQKILDYVMFFDSISLIAAASSVFILRYKAKKSPPKEQVFKIWGYPYLPVLYVLIYVAVNLSVLLSNKEASVIGFLLFLSGLPLFYAVRLLFKPIKLVK